MIRVPSAVLPLVLSFILAQTACSSAPVFTARELANRIVSSVRTRNQIPLAVIRSLTVFCIRPDSIEVQPSKVSLSILFMYPENRHGNSDVKVSDCSAMIQRSLPYKGIIFLLPGYGMQKSALLPYAEAFAGRGFVAVMVDLRGQGASTGDHIGYGKLEAKDLRRLVVNLRKHGLAGKEVGLFGISYGAAVALDAAAVMPDVNAVVAVAPYAKVAPTVQKFVKRAAPKKTAHMTPAVMNHAIALAGKIVGYPLSLSDPLRWAGKIKASVLYIAGEEDHITPIFWISRLRDKTAHSSLIILKNKNHITLAMDTATLKRDALEWFVRFLNTAKQRHVR